MAREYPRIYVDGVRLLVVNSQITDAGTVFEHYGIRLGCLPLGIPFRHAGNGWAVIDVEVHPVAPRTQKRSSTSPGSMGRAIRRGSGGA